MSTEETGPGSPEPGHGPSENPDTLSRELQPIPARMLNEFAYCPRLAYLEWVQGEWAENVETLEGKHTHRRVEKAEETARIHDRSIHLTSERLGLTAVVDILERDGERARPVDYKRGRKPSVHDGAYEPERVQLCAQGLLLREHGFECNEGVLYFAASKERVRVLFTEALVERTLELLREMRGTVGRGEIPPPLEDSPKCPRCSLVSLCLPEEIRFLRQGGTVRPLAVLDPAAHPLVVQDPKAGVRLSGEQLLVELDGTTEARARLGEISQVVLMGGARCTMPALHRCLEEGIPVVHMSGTGWFYGVTRGFDHKNIEVRIAQFSIAREWERALDIARRLVAAKILNSRVLLRRNGPAGSSDRELGLLSSFAERTRSAPDSETLLGIEGSAAKVYYGCFTSMLKVADNELPAFQLEKRNRRPPSDPTNALLSFVNALLTKDWTTTLYTVGLDPLLGFYHQPRFGKPALALDMMEPFRPVIAESVVIGALNNGEVHADDFQATPGGVLLRPAARRSVVAAYERRMAQKVLHPIFGYRCTYRRLFEIEARLLARHLLGETLEYEPYRIR